MRGRDRLAQVRDRLARWRVEHGGRGIRVPEVVWTELVEVARAEGVEATRSRRCRLFQLGNGRGTACATA